MCMASMCVLSHFGYMVVVCWHFVGGPGRKCDELWCFYVCFSVENGTYATIIKQRIIETLFIAKASLLMLTHCVCVCCCACLSMCISCTAQSVSLFIKSIVYIRYILPSITLTKFRKCHKYYFCNFSFHRISEWWKFMVCTITSLHCYRNRLWVEIPAPDPHKL